MPPARRLHLPTEDSREEAEDAFRKMCQALVIELGDRFDQVGRHQIGTDWVKQIVSVGHDEKERQNWKSPYDPSFVFGEPIGYSSSIVWRAIPKNAAVHGLLVKCRWARNRWEHNAITPSLSQLREDMTYFAGIAKEANLGLGEGLPALQERVDQILNGTFAVDPDVNPGESEGSPTGTPSDPAIDEEIEKDDRAHRAREAERVAAAQRQSRPRIGGVWNGPLPERALQFRRQLNDLVDAQTKTSVKGKWGEDAKLQIARLKLIDPMGDLYVDDADGALFGYKHGVGYLLGYIGSEPERDPREIQGFAMPDSYYMDEGDLYQVSTRKTLSSQRGETAMPLLAVLRKAVNELDEIKITTHGDLFSITEEGIVKIARVAAEDWFPGQLPG
jgi:hypothetical protein